jgi:hypothetical protein
MGWPVESHTASSTASRADFASSGKSKAHLAERKKQRPKQGEGRFSCAVPCLAVLWADGERAGDNGIAVVSCK